MPKKVIMPALGMAQDSGLLVSWLKNEGDSVQQGEPIMEIETDKITVEIEAPTSGTLVNVLAHAGDDVPVGEAVAYILYAGETSSDLPLDETRDRKPEPATQSEAKTVPVVAGGISPVAARMIAEHDINIADIPANGGRITKAHIETYLEQVATKSHAYRLIPASPKARRLASEKGYALSDMIGTGPEGAIITQDVLDFVPAKDDMQTRPEPVKSESRTIETGRMWQVMAQRMTQSWQMIPHFYLKRDVNADALIDWRTMLKQQSDVSVTYTDLLVKTCAMALLKHERLNACYKHEVIIANDAIHIGLAIAVDDGLLVPVIHHADQLTVREIAVRRAELVKRAQDNKLQPADMANGTFTISNLGMFGINEFSAIVNPPQVAILAVGNMQSRLEMIDGQMTQKQIMTLSLSCDHRAVDGARGAQFLQTLASYTEDPRMMLS